MCPTGKSILVSGSCRTCGRGEAVRARRSCEGAKKGDSPSVARGQRDQKANVVIHFGGRVVPDDKSSGKMFKVMFQLVIQVKQTKHRKTDGFVVFI